MVASLLASIPLFRTLPQDAMAAVADMWEVYELTEGQRLWSQGDLGDYLCVLAWGELVVEVGSQSDEVGRVMPGELFGELAAFQLGGVRSAGVRALLDSMVLALPASALRRLREEFAPLYELLLLQALKSCVRRIRAVDRSVAALSWGDQEVPVRAEPSVMGRIWNRLKSGGPESRAPALAPILGRNKAFKKASHEVIYGVAHAFSLRAISEGEVIFLEGEEGTGCFVVAEGAVDILRHVRGNKTTRLANAGVGALIGVNTLVDGGSRTASCVATEPGWLYFLTPADMEKMAPVPRRWWMECMLGSLTYQLQNANNSLIQLHEQNLPVLEADALEEIGDSPTPAVVQALGMLERVDTDQAGLLEIDDLELLDASVLEPLSTEDAPKL